MMRLIHNRGRRRVTLTVLFIVLATVSMIGPTQAVSGIVTASVAVMETFAQALGGVDRAIPKPAAAPQAGLAEWFDAALTPDFAELVGTLPPQAESELPSGVDAMPALTTAGSQSNTQAHSNGFVGGGWSGNQGGGHAAPSGSGLSGLGGGGGHSPGSFADTPEGRALAAMDLTLESSAASLAAGSLDASIEGFEGASPLDPVGLGPGPGSIPGDGFPIPDTALVPPPNPFSPSLPTPPVAAGSTPSVAGGLTPSVASPPTAGPPPNDNVPSPSVVEDLLEDLGIPPSVAANLDPGSAVAQSAVGLLQVPEPSVMVLGAIGAVAAARRYRRRNADRRQ